MKLYFIILLLLGNITYNLNAQSVLNVPVKDIDGNITTIENQADGDIIVLDFWTTWCKPCLKSVPKLAELSEKYKTHGVSFIGVNEDSPRNLVKVKPMSKALGFNYPIILDTDQSIMSSLLITSFPTLVILDKNEKVLYLHEGYISGDEEIIESKIKIIIDSAKDEK
ncbi:MAG: TlpA family protein disulfide reductase [Bacteroidales bacterium]|nr:TlpA family protein disulfide reductase [Bacteroidales bacterium]MBN2821442.1 TlpA family protein disulfide reductase [Bacteroidales bacterium]